ncbi:MAG: MASE3 domain-containing protein, partial [Rhodoferax sp.]|nr:MASE3 domain-containing protein [Rhodoferax sp.]
MSRLNIHTSQQREAVQTFRTLGWFGLVMLLLLWLPTPDGIRGISNYLALHTALETGAIVVACLVFAVGWHTPRRQTVRNHLLLACAFLGVALLDFSHLLSYPGMPDYITPSHVEKSINFWLAARALAALTLLAVAWLPWRTLINQRQARLLLAGVMLLVLLLHGLFIFQLDQLPRTFVPGQGLTLYKVTVEYGLIALYLLSAGLFARQLRAPRSINTSGLMAVAVLMAMSEIFFTLYADVTDVYSLAGHIYKVVAYVFLYRALFLETVQQPYEQLRASQNQLLATLNALPDLLFELDAQGNYVQTHARQEGQLVAPLDTLLGKNIRDVMPVAAAQTCLQAVQEALRTGVSHGRLIELDVPEGHRWFELSVARKPGLSGAEADLSHVLVISRDVTERVLFESALQQEMQLKEVLLDLQKQAESKSDEQLLRHVLARAQRITGSALGFAGWVEPDQSAVSRWVATGQDLADTITAQTAAWPLADLPLWRRAAQLGESLQFNDWTQAAASPEQPGCPAGVQRWIGVPTTEAGQVCLLAAVANKPEPYTDADLQALRLLFDAVWRLLQKRYAERDLQARQEEIASFFSANLDLFCIGNVRGEFTRMNPGWEQVLGWPTPKLLGHRFMDYVHPDDLASTQQAMTRLLVQPGPVDLENRLRCRDGSYRHIGWRVIAKGDTVYASARDITQRIEDELLMSRLMLAVSQNPNPIIVTDLEANIVYVNEAFTTCTGYTAREVLGRNPSLLASGNTSAATYRDMWRLLQLGQPWHGEFSNRRKNGEPLIEQALIYPVRDPAGQIRNYLALKEDITDRKAAEERIRQLSNYDQLTGLPNRELLRERFRYAESLARRNAEGMALIWVNLANFKN